MPFKTCIKPSVGRTVSNSIVSTSQPFVTILQRSISNSEQVVDPHSSKPDVKLIGFKLEHFSIDYFPDFISFKMLYQFSKALKFF